MFVFNKPSSPTSYEMPPGMYVCTAALSGNVRGKQAVSVGLAGADHEDVTIAMPSTSFVFSALKRQWNILQQMAVWVGMVIGMFLMQPRPDAQWKRGR